MTNEQEQPESNPSILHVCRREILRPIRDQVLRNSGYEVESTCHDSEALDMFREHQFDLVLVDVEGQDGVPNAEQLCADIKTIHPGQLVAFLCNWQVAVVSDCPDEVLRAEFDPAAFVKGVNDLLEPATMSDRQGRQDRP